MNKIQKRVKKKEKRRKRGGITSFVFGYANIPLFPEKEKERRKIGGSSTVSTSLEISRLFYFYYLTGYLIRREFYAIYSFETNF